MKRSALAPKQFTPKQLYDLFALERARFARVFPRAKHTRMLIEWARCISPGMCAYRNLAYETLLPHGPVVVMHRRVLQLPRANIVGLIRHELGHVSDARIEEAGREQRADDLAERVSGRKIRYDAHEVETTGPGTYPRPRHLPR